MDQCSLVIFSSTTALSTVVHVLPIRASAVSGRSDAIKSSTLSHSIPDTLNLDLLTDAHATNTGLLSLSINEALTLNESVTLDESISESARFDGPLSIMPNSPAAFPNVFPTTIADGDIHFADSPPQSPSPSPRQPPSPITQIEAGTYSIHVTIHEVKDLPTTPPQHPQPVIFPSPVIFLNISNADTPFTVNTQVLPYTPSGSYNRSYHAQLPYSTPLSFTSSTLTLSVLNATAPTIPLEKLGTHTIDLIRVYSAPGHALTRRWLALSNGGFVKMSLALAGPGHAVPPSFFDVDTPEIEREQREEEMEVFTEPVVPMEVKRVRKYLVATFYELQDLDLLSGQTPPPTDLHVTVSLNNSHISTKPVPYESPLRINTEVWLPVTLPVLSSVVKYQLYASTTLLATFTTTLASLPSTPSAPIYANIYGAEPSSSPPTPATLSYNNFPDKLNAPCYKGRFLLSHYLTTNIPATHLAGATTALANTIASPTPGFMSPGTTTNRNAVHHRQQVEYKKRIAAVKSKGKPFRRHLREGLSADERPRTVLYKVFAVVVSGTEMPDVGADVEVRLQCGRAHVTTAPVPAVNGVCKFHQLIEIEGGVEVPVEGAPDVTVCIGTSEGGRFSTVAYSRVKFGVSYLEPAWIMLREDKANDRLPAEQFPGALLLQLCVVRADDVDGTLLVSQWRGVADQLREPRLTKEYELHCNIYVAADLPPVEPTVPLDPYYTVTVNGLAAKRGAVVRQDNYPKWFETVTFRVELGEAKYFPMVTVRLFDEELSGMDDYLSCVNVGLKEGDVWEGGALPEPRWRDLYVEQEGDTTGRLLASFMLVPVTEGGARMGGVVREIPPIIKPHYRDVTIAASIVGLVNLTIPVRDHGRHYRRPSVSFSLGTQALGVTLAGSSWPSRLEPRFNSRNVFTVRVPDGSEFLGSYPIVVRVWEEGEGGGLVGWCVVPLEEVIGGPIRANPTLTPRKMIEGVGSGFVVSPIVSPRPKVVNRPLDATNRFQLGRDVLDCPLEDMQGVKSPFFVKDIVGVDGGIIGGVRGCFKVAGKEEVHKYKELRRKGGKEYVVRVYVLTGSGFVGEWGRRPGLGWTVYIGGEMVREGSGNVTGLAGEWGLEIYECVEGLFEVGGDVVGGGEARVVIWEEKRTRRGGGVQRVIIGETVVDLLDRFCDKGWWGLGADERLPLEGKEKEKWGEEGVVNYDRLDEVAMQTPEALMEADDGDDPLEPPPEAALHRHGASKRCTLCSAKYCYQLNTYMCYCKQIGWIQHMHLRLEPKPVELRQVMTATSKLPRGSLRMWVDMMPQSDARMFPASYFLKNDYVRGLFVKLKNGRRHKDYVESELINDIERLTGINRAGVFFGKTAGNSVVRLCIEFGHEKLLRYFLRMHPLAAFVRVMDDGENVHGDDDSYTSEEEEEEEEGGEEPGMAADHIRGETASGNAGEAANSSEFELNHTLPNLNPDARAPAQDKGMDCFEYAILVGKFEMVQAMLEEVSKPLVEKMKYLPEPLTRHMKMMMKHEYFDLVERALKVLPLAYIEKTVTEEVDGKSKKVTHVEVRTALPDLGSLGFLMKLTDNVDTSVFDSDTMALVVQDLWDRGDVKWEFYKECCAFCVFVLGWCGWCEFYTNSVQKGTESEHKGDLLVWLYFIVLGTLNSYFVVKEWKQAKKQAESRADAGTFAASQAAAEEEDNGVVMAAWSKIGLGRGNGGVGQGAKRSKMRKRMHMHLSFKEYAKSYLDDPYNRVDLLNIALVFLSLLSTKFHWQGSVNEVAVASLATLTLTYKCMSYMRGNEQTGWLTKVLFKNVVDMQGFLFIMFVLILGFTVVFRLLLSKLPNGGCDVIGVNEDSTAAVEWDCAPAPYEGFTESLFHVFTMSVLGDFDTGLFDDVQHSTLSKVMFIILMVGVAVVSLNAVIALLGDSYAEVNENKNATMRGERANLIIEHLLLMTTEKRRAVEKRMRICTSMMTKKDWISKGGQRGARMFESDVDNVVDEVEGLRKELGGLREEIRELRSEVGRGGL